MTINITTVMLLIVLCTPLYGQRLALSFEEADTAGISIDHLDSVYQSAVNIDTSLAVFKTEQEQDSMAAQFLQLLNDLGAFLSKHSFYWTDTVHCFNRIYFSPDGTIDYFLFNFLERAQSKKPTPERQERFKTLLNRFIQDYHLTLKARTRFVQCGSSTNLPTKTNE